MRRLGCLFLFIGIRRRGQIFAAVLSLDIFADLRQGVIGDAGRIGTHVGNESDQTLFAQFHAFVQALRNHHGALHAETQLAGGILLELAGGKGRGRVAPALLAIDGADPPVGLLDGGADFFRVIAVGDLDLLLVLAEKTGVESRGLGAGEIRVDRPVFLLFEGLDFAFAFDDEPQGHGLHAPGRYAASDFVPKKRGNLIADEAIEDAAGLLGIDQGLIDASGMLESLLHGFLCNLVESNAADSFSAFLIPFLLLFLFTLRSIAG